MKTEEQKLNKWLRSTDRYNIRQNRFIRKYMVEGDKTHVSFIDGYFDPKMVSRSNSRRTWHQNTVVVGKLFLLGKIY